VITVSTERKGDAKLSARNRHGVGLALAGVSQEGMGAGFGKVLVPAIFAGWLIALTVWLSHRPAGDENAFVLVWQEGTPRNLGQRF
jgi:formate/nitrite transporter FocA (FNT family)